MLLIAAAGPIGFSLINTVPGCAQSAASPPSFEVATIKPNHGGGGFNFGFYPGGRFVAENVTLGFVLEAAYAVKHFQVAGAPGWLDSEHYNIEGRPESAFLDKEPKLTAADRQTQRWLIVQALLADRAKLKVHHETRELPVYALVVAKGGPKIHQTGDPSGEPRPRRGLRMIGRGELSSTAYGLNKLADVLSQLLDRVVLDQTGLPGSYDYTLRWTPAENQDQFATGAGDRASPQEAAPPAGASGPSIFTALREQLGLALESRKNPVEILVIDHIEKPSEN